MLRAFNWGLYQTSRREIRSGSQSIPHRRDFPLAELTEFSLLFA